MGRISKPVAGATKGNKAAVSHASRETEQSRPGIQANPSSAQPACPRGPSRQDRRGRRVFTQRGTAPQELRRLRGSETPGTCLLSVSGTRLGYARETSSKTTKRGAGRAWPQPPRRGGPDPHLSGWPSSGPSSRIAAPRPGPRPSAPGTPSGNRTQTRQASRLRCRVDKGTRGGVYRTSDKTNTQQESFKLRMCADVQAAGNRLGSSRRLGEASLFAGGSSFVSSALTFPLLILSRK